MSIGARSQSAKTYLEKHFESFLECQSPFNCVVRTVCTVLRDTLYPISQVTWTRSLNTAFTHFETHFNKTKNSPSSIRLLGLWDRSESLRSSRGKTLLDILPPWTPRTITMRQRNSQVRWRRWKLILDPLLWLVITNCFDFCNENEEYGELSFSQTWSSFQETRAFIRLAAQKTTD